MKKHNKFVKIIFSVFIFTLSFFTLNVRAEEADIDTTIDCKDGDQVCLDNSATCISQLNKEFDFKAYTKDNDKIVISVEGKSTDTFNIVVYAYENGNKVTKDKRVVNGRSGYEIPANVSKNTSYDYTIEALLTSSTSVGEGDEKVDCQGKFWQAVNLSNVGTQPLKVKNTSLNANGLCTLYLNGTLTKERVKKEVGKDKAGNYTKLLSGNNLSYEKVKTYNAEKDGESYFKELLPYCFSDTVSKVYSGETLLNNIKTAAEVVYNNSILYSNTFTPIQGNDDFVDFSSNDLTKSISLTCDAFGTKNGDKYLSADNVRKFKRIEYSAPKTANYTYASNVEVCRTVCEEDVTVTYGPPVAVKAGMCFEYEVEIESKVKCGVDKISGGAPVKQSTAVCTHSISCVGKWNGGHVSTQAGPNEEFDSCINTCDGGKYSQSCINSCYKKVYGSTNSKSKVNLELAYNALQRLAGNPAYCDPDTYLKNNSLDNLVNAICTADDAYNTTQHGKYEKGSDGIIKWKATDTCYWSGYADFYFTLGWDYVSNTTECKRTVLDDGKVIKFFAYDNGNLNQQKLNNYNWYTRTWNSNTWYYPDGLGVKHAHYISSNTDCDDDCTIYASNCGDDGDDLLTADIDDINYAKDLDTYNKTLEECNASAVCDTKKSKYKMSVNNVGGSASICTTADNGNEKCIVWDDDSSKTKCERNSENVSSKTNLDLLKTAKDGCLDVKNGESIIREISGVCTGINGDTQDYRSIIAFPGTWIRNKGGKRYYQKPDKEQYYQYVPGQYCLPLTVSNVNVDWWTWDQFYQRAVDKVNTVNYSTATDVTGTSFSKYGGVYNIFAKIEDFGYFNWNVDVSCFFAATNTEPECENGVCPPVSKCTGSNCNNDDNPDPKCTGDSCTNGSLNSETRAAALDDLFPTSDDTASGVKSDSTKTVSPTKLGNNVDKEVSVTKVADTNTSTERTPGYNWTCDATSFVNKNYPITPTALISKIQSVGDSVFNDKNELDYQVVITTSDIKKIREYNKGKQYTDYGTDVYTNKSNGIEFYQSKFLKNYTQKGKYYSPSQHTCNNIKNRQCDLLKDFVRNETVCTKLINERSAIGL